MSSVWCLKLITCAVTVRLSWWILLSMLCFWMTFGLRFFPDSTLDLSSLMCWSWTHLLFFLFWEHVAVKVQTKAVHQLLLGGHTCLSALTAQLLRGAGVFRSGIRIWHWGKDLVHVFGELQQSAFALQALTSTSIVREGGLNQRPRALPDWRTLASFCRDEWSFLFFSLQLEGHGHTEVGVVDEAVGEHEVDADDGRQHVDLTDENEGQGQQAGQTDGCYRSPVWSFLLQRERVS